MIEAFEGVRPRLGNLVFVAPSASVIGDVELGDGASVWHGAVVRGDVWKIRIGEFTNVQDLCACHVTTGGPELVVGSRVTIGHRAVLHSCAVEDDCLIGMGAVLLDNVHIGQGSIVAAGSVLLSGFIVPPQSLVAGTPATVKRNLDPAEVGKLAQSAMEYHRLALSYLGISPFVPPGRLP